LFSPIARRHRPLRRISDLEQQQAIESLQGLIVRLGEDSEIPDWAKQIVTDGLARIITILKYLRFFGHDAAIESIIILDNTTRSLTEALWSEFKSGCSTLFDVAKVLVTIVGLFNAPNTAATAYITYKGLWEANLQANKQAPALPKPSDNPEAHEPGGNADLNGVTD